VSAETEFNTNTAQVVADLVRTHIAPVRIDLKHPTDGTTAPVVILPLADGGLSINPIDKLFDAYRENPQRREGTAVMKDIDSFIAHVNRFKTDESALFADPSKTAPALLAVIDYHERVNLPRPAVISDDGEVITPVADDCDFQALPQFGRHRTSYKFPLSPEWQAWSGQNGKAMSQTDFAAFIEERILDILAAPTFQGDLSEQDKKLKRLSDLLNGNFASPEKMMALSRGLAIFESARVINATNINSGEGVVTFEEEHQDSEGKKLVVPNLFCLGIPVFDGGDAYRVVVRLRYRKQGAAIVWFYDLYRHDEVFEDAFKGACVIAAEGTGLPLFVGAPEVAA